MSLSQSIDERRLLAAVRLWSLSILMCTVSIGLALARVLPPSIPVYVPILLSTLVLALNICGVWLTFDGGTFGSVECRAAAALSLVGPLLTAFSWTTGGWGVLVWVLFLLVAGLATGELWEARRRQPQPEITDKDSDPVADLSQHSGEVAVAVDSLQPDEECLQRIVRRTEAGVETIEFEAMVGFQPGEQHVSFHVPIVPPLSAIPDVECEPLDDAEIVLQIDSAYTYGVRIACRRKSAEKASQVRVGVLLSAPLEGAAAA